MSGIKKYALNIGFDQITAKPRQSKAVLTMEYLYMKADNVVPLHVQIIVNNYPGEIKGSNATDASAVFYQI